MEKLHIFHQNITSFDIIRDFYEENMLNILYPFILDEHYQKRQLSCVRIH
jgi:hypothetical protein